MFTDTEDTCLRHNEHVVLCRVTKSLFLLHIEVDAVPYFSTCNSDNERETLNATTLATEKREQTLSL
jgi:hypothetical protein